MTVADLAKIVKILHESGDGNIQVIYGDNEMPIQTWTLTTRLSDGSIVLKLSSR